MYRDINHLDRIKGEATPDIGRETELDTVREPMPEIKDGYREGSKAGYRDGTKAGYREGTIVGYREGTKAGYREGTKTGYIERIIVRVRNKVG